MKLYVISHKTNKKHYLAQSAPTRDQLAMNLGSPLFKIDNELFTVKNVVAEKESSGAATGMALGGLLGLFGGAAGVIAGGAIGAILGQSADEQEQSQVEHFNRS